MTAAERDWRTRIDATKHEDELLAIVRAYLAELTPAELESIPEHVRPHHMVDAEELASSAYRLVNAHCASVSGPDDGGVLFRLATFFAYAHSRSTFLASPAARQRAYAARAGI